MTCFQNKISHILFLILECTFIKDKVMINTLTMIAEDYSTSFPVSCAALYQQIHKRLLSPKVPSAYKLPLVYVVDSILKNVGELYIGIIGPQISEWMKVLFEELYIGIIGPQIS